jgi:hypothetical protein
MQVVGAFAAIEAGFFQEPFLLGATFLMWLPGSLIWVEFYKQFTQEGTWFDWAMAGAAVFLNVLIFATMSYVRAKRRKPS